MQKLQLFWNLAFSEKIKQESENNVNNGKCKSIVESVMHKAIFSSLLRAICSHLIIVLMCIFSSGNLRSLFYCLRVELLKEQIFAPYL
jgi:hypothetical protein